jgi:hypothetical protein
MATAALVMSVPAVAVRFGMTAVLNAKPDGALRIRVTLVPAAKSALAPSAIVTAPRVVHAGDEALAAVSADMLLPPAAPVTVTAAEARLKPIRAKAEINRTARRTFLAEFIGRELVTGFM